MLSAVLGYFGPPGTFTHQALLSFSQEPAVPFPTVIAALDAVRRGEVDSVLVPIENSVEGGVSATLDALSQAPRLMIVREVLLPVQFGLYGRPGTGLGDVTRALTHPHAAAQVRHWFSSNLPDAVLVEGGSTAAAAQQVADPASSYQAAVCAQVAADIYGLVPLATDIADNPDAVTRFVQVTTPGLPPQPSGADKTTLVAYMYADHPGALLEILEQFSGRGVNLCRIESRPTKKFLGDYCFSIDAEGHLQDARLAEALLGLHRICRDVVFLGSYQRADGVAPDVRRGFSDAEFRSATEWFHTLLAPDE